MVIAVQNSQQNKKKKEIVGLNFGINYTLQQTIAMLKILNVVINVSLNHTVHTSSLPWAKPFYKPTQNLKWSCKFINHNRTKSKEFYSVLESYKQSTAVFFAWACALRLDKEHVTSDSDSGA